jgi:hypothetical protein
MTLCFPMAVAQLSETSVTIRRNQGFLLLEEKTGEDFINGRNNHRFITSDETNLNSEGFPKVANPSKGR